MCKKLELGAKAKSQSKERDLGVKFRAITRSYIKLDATVRNLKLEQELGAWATELWDIIIEPLRPFKILAEKQPIVCNNDIFAHSAKSTKQTFYN